MSGRSLILTFVGLIAMAVLSWILADAGTGTAVALIIATVKALAIALVFMELAEAHAVDRTIAAVAVLFVILLCVGSLADVALR